jgi:hypothetical protein
MSVSIYLMRICGSVTFVFLVLGRRQFGEGFFKGCGRDGGNTANGALMRVRAHLRVLFVSLVCFLPSLFSFLLSRYTTWEAAMHGGMAPTSTAGQMVGDVGDLMADIEGRTSSQPYCLHTGWTLDNLLGECKILCLALPPVHPLFILDSQSS